MRTPAFAIELALRLAYCRGEGSDVARKGRARITISSVLEYAGEVAGRFEGVFVALGPKGSP